VPRASIVNGPEIFVHHGSLINLTCVVIHGTDLPVYIYWYHHNKVVEYEGRGDVTVTTHTTGNTVSTLVVENAGSRDSGKYSCKPSNGQEDAITLHVLQGEHSAPMQTNAAYHSQPTFILWQLISIILFLSIYTQWCSFYSSYEETILPKSKDPTDIYSSKQETANLYCIIHSISDSQSLNASVKFRKKDYRMR
ncbi:unnamed protein product, partial [Meganyctiphanes norvegica]